MYVTSQYSLNKCLLLNALYKPRFMRFLPFKGVKIHRCWEVEVESRAWEISTRVCLPLDARCVSGCWNGCRSGGCCSRDGKVSTKPEDRQKVRVCRASNSSRELERIPFPRRRRRRRRLHRLRATCRTCRCNLTTQFSVVVAVCACENGASA